MAVVVLNSGDITCLAADTKPAAIDGRFALETDTRAFYERSAGAWALLFTGATAAQAAAWHTQAHALSGADHTGALVEAQTPLTTKGDLLVTDGTTLQRVAVGTNDQVLTADSAQANGIKWAGAGAGNATNSHMVAYAALSKTMASIGSTFVDIYVALTDLGNDKHLIDFAGATSFRIIFFWDYVGSGSQETRWVDKADNANVLWASAAFSADQDPGDSGWTALPGWVTGSMTIEQQGKSSNAFDDPVPKGFRIFLK